VDLGSPPICSSWGIVVGGNSIGNLVIDPNNHYIYQTFSSDVGSKAALVPFGWLKV